MNQKNKKILGILGLFIFIFGATYLKNPDFFSAYNMQNLVKWSSLFAIMGIGVAFVIITGGIDLSIGSVIGLVASLMALAIDAKDGWGWHPGLAVAVMLTLSLFIGLVHGLLITKVKLQPFVVTLCGLLIYRGLARWMTDNKSMGYKGAEKIDSFFSGKVALTAEFALPAPFFFLLIIAILAGALFAHAGLAVLGKEVLLVAEVDQRVQPVDGFGPDRSARAAVPAIGTTVFNVFFAPERHATAPACARADIDFAQVKKLHQKGLSGHVWS